MDKDKRTSVYFDRKNLCFVGLEEAHLKHLKDIYKGVDVDSELKKMSLWLTSSKGIKRKGTIGFIINWLNKQNPTKASKAPESYDHIDQDSPLRPLINEYLSDLWKGKEHILEINKIRKKS